MSQSTHDNARRKAPVPMPWLLLTLVVVTVAAAVFASTTDQRLMALALAEVSIVWYFCAGLMRTARHVPPHDEAAPPEHPSAR